jgi:glycosyltransferase involved in cell wall biosynthesis
MVSAIERLGTVAKRVVRRAGRLARIDRRPGALLLVTGGGEWAIKQIAVSLEAELRSRYPAVEIVDLIGRRPFITRANLHFLCRPAFFTGAGIPDVDASNRVVVSWLHGGRKSGDPELVAACDQLERHWRRVRRFVVPNRTSYESVVECGVDPAIVRLIPNGIDTRAFRPADAAARARVRARLGLAADAYVVGSFQRDGDDDGKPKLVKGPDTLVETLTEVHGRRPIVALLAGSGRTYVRQRLEAAGVPYVYHWAADAAELAEMYGALDLYLITSREEGGPVALRESMASGIPVVSTRMGLAADLIEHGKNGFVAEPGDAAGLAKLVGDAIDSPALVRDAARAALETIGALDFRVIAARLHHEVYREAFA